MKATTKPVITSIQFDENDIAVDNQWYSIGIRHWVGGEHGYLWLFTPRHPNTAHEGLSLITYTDEDMKSFITDGEFTYVGSHLYLRNNAPRVG